MSSILTSTLIVKPNGPRDIPIPPVTLWFFAIKTSTAIIYNSKISTLALYKNRHPPLPAQKTAHPTATRLSYLPAKNLLS